jgi:hypothetical protein
MEVPVDPFIVSVFDAPATGLSVAGRGGKETRPTVPKIEFDEERSDA